VVWRSLKKLKVDLPFDPTIPLLNIYPKECKYRKGTCIPMFTRVHFTRAELWNPPRCPTTDKWIKKILNIIFTYNYIIIYNYY
jgi:hypothetical protein